MPGGLIALMVARAVIDRCSRDEREERSEIASSVAIEAMAELDEGDDAVISEIVAEARTSRKLSELSEQRRAYLLRRAHLRSVLPPTDNDPA